MTYLFGDDIRQIADLFGLTDYEDVIHARVTVLYIKHKDEWETAKMLALIGDLHLINSGHIGAIDRPYYLTFNTQDLIQWKTRLKNAKRSKNT